MKVDPKLVNACVNAVNRFYETNDMEERVRMKEDYKVDPLSIKVDQTKKDTRRDAWDRDYMGYYYLKEEPKSNKQISNATPVFIFAFFYIAILVMIGSIK